MVATDAADSEGAGVEPVVSPDARRFLDESCGKSEQLKRINLQNQKLVYRGGQKNLCRFYKDFRS